MILGGDPQCVYHFGLLSLLLFSTILWQPTPFFIRLALVRRLSGKLAIVLVLTILASFVQLWPTWLAAGNSIRTVSAITKEPDENREEQAKSVQTKWMDSVATDLKKLEIQKRQFSQPPWHIATLLWGNVFGTSSRLHGRWDKQIPSGDRLWHPSLYQGILPVLLVIPLLFYRRKERNDSNEQLLLIRWLWFAFLLFGFGSFGWYGLGWVWLEIQSLIHPSTEVPWIAPEFGGIYWILTFLPGYSDFRYPAKLWIVSSFSISVLAGFSLDQFRTSVHFNHLPKRIRLTALFIGATSLGLLLLLSSPEVSAQLANWQPLAPNDFWLGTFSKATAFSESCVTLAYTFILCCVFIWLLGKIPSPTDLQGICQTRHWTGLVLILVGICDLVIAGGWTIHTGPNTSFRLRDPFKKKQSHENEIPARMFFNHQQFWKARNLAIADLFLKRGTDKNESQVEYKEFHAVTLQTMHRFLHPQFHLLQSIGSTNAFHTLYPRNQYLLEKFALNDSNIFHEYLKEMVANQKKPKPNDWFTFSTNWIVRPEIQTDELNELLHDIEKTWISPEGNWIPISQRIVLNHTPPAFKKIQSSIEPTKDSFQTHLIHYGGKNAEMQLQVQAGSPGILVIRRAFDPGWTARINQSTESSLTPIKVNRLFCGFVIPKGQYQLTITYLPAWFTYGKWVSIIAWFTIACGHLYFCYLPQKSGRQPEENAAT